MKYTRENIIWELDQFIIDEDIVQALYKNIITELEDYETTNYFLYINEEDIDLVYCNKDSCACLYLIQDSKGCIIDFDYSYHIPIQVLEEEFV